MTLTADEESDEEVGCLLLYNEGVIECEWGTVRVLALLLGLCEDEPRLTDIGSRGGARTGWAIVLSLSVD